MSKLPDFIVVGCAKAGTTSLFNLLNSHDEIYIPKIKETRFFSQMPTNQLGDGFANGGIRNTKDYLNLFTNFSHKICGDMSNDYFYHYKKSIYNIKKIYNAKNCDLPKIIILIRNPYSRVISHFYHIKRIINWNYNFIEHFNSSENFLKRKYSWIFDLKGCGMTYDAVKAYQREFKNIKIYFYDDLINGYLNEEIGSFLKLDKKLPNNFPSKNLGIYFNENSLKKIIINLILMIEDRLNNYGKNIISIILKKIIIKIKTFFPFVFKGEDAMKAKLINKIKPFYNKDISKLEKLLKKDLSKWK